MRSVWIFVFVPTLAAFHLPNRVGECLMFVVQTLPLVRARHIGQKLRRRISG